MIVIEVERVEVDHCLACGGVWLDGGELELLLEGASNRDTLLAGLEAMPRSGERKLRCPICSKKLDKVRYGNDSPVVLDRCGRGDGFWFDRNELCRALREGQYAGRPVYEILNEIFGGSCGNRPAAGPGETGPAGNA